MRYAVSAARFYNTFFRALKAASHARLPPVVRSAIVDLYLSPWRRALQGSGGDRPRIRARLARWRAARRAGVETGRHARYAHSRRSRHRRLDDEAEVRQHVVHAHR